MKGVSLWFVCCCSMIIALVFILICNAFMVSIGCYDINYAQSQIENDSFCFIFGMYILMPTLWFGLMITEIIKGKIENGNKKQD